uniref:xanthine dehydrogenase n=1 Tax=Parastrongyloides trichosuri TaxID=131310 RepID=A0A0N4ZXA3_PARTI
MKEICRKLIFYVNGRRQEIEYVDPKMTLATFLRDHLLLTGTKIGCNEGGCGACTVMLSDIDPITDKVKHYSVNSCLTPLCSVFGKSVTTIEGISDLGKGRLHQVQERLIKAHGSQCGFCTPGFVMAMYSLLRNNPNPTTNEIDEALQGNLCRCTGYRPILEAFYSFASDGNLKIKEKNPCSKGEDCCKNKKSSDSCDDREDFFSLSIFDKEAPYTNDQEPIFPSELIIKQFHKKSFKLSTPKCIWYTPTSLNKLVELKNKHPWSRIISGNSEVAVELKFRFIELPIIINPKQVPEMRKTYLDYNKNAVYVGTNLSLNEMKTVLERYIKELPCEKTKVFKAIVSILHYFAGNHVRNTASIAGNIVTASPISDLNPVWLACGAEIELVSSEGGTRILKIDENFFTGYRKTLIECHEILVGIWIPFSEANQYFQAFKQAQRREDDIAIVTSAFSVTIENDPNNNFSENEKYLIKDVKIAFGGMAPITKMAINTMKLLVGKAWNKDINEIASQSLIEEFKLPASVPGGMAKYRMSLTVSFFFKFYVYVSKEITPFLFQEYGIDSALEEPKLPQFKTSQIYYDVPKGQEGYDGVGRPIGHLSGERQITGEAMYVGDLPIARCLHMALFLSPVAKGIIQNIDPTEALQEDGVVGYFDKNNVPKGARIGHGDTYIFAENEVLFHGQPICGIVAEDHETARRAVNKIKVEILSMKPILTIEDALEANSYHQENKLSLHSSLTLNDKKEIFDYSSSKHVIEGEIRMGGQEHFYLETSQVLVIPGERDEMEVISSTQCVNDTQKDVCKALNIPLHKVSVKVKRIGGGFGGKESTAGLIAAPAAIAAKALKRPVKLVLERFDDMALTGTRHPYRFNYKVALNEQLKLKSLEVNCYSNSGATIDLSGGVLTRAMTHIDNVYKWDNADIYGYLCKTNISSNTAFRGFGGPQGMFCTETIMSHVSEILNVDVDKLREVNFYKEGDVTHFGMTLRKCNISRCWDECKSLSNYNERKEKVERFNEHSKYKKRGIYLLPTKFGIGFGFKQLNQAGCLINVYTDGSVLISHGGMEMGQGLHTKMVQVASRCLQIPIEKIEIHETSSDKVPNASPTAASVGSDMNGIAIKNGCDILMERLKPFKEANPNGKWEDWVMAAYVNRVSLSVTGFGIIHCESIDFMDGKGAEAFGYAVYGVACTEVEIDCLTGDHHMIRSDIVMDVGDSLNPAIDIGQIEGAFIQGYGLFTMEEIKIRSDGVRHTRGPGTYKIPSADDVPRHFNVKLLKGSSNKMAIFSSKAVGEPPLFLGSSAFFAIKEAIKAYRKDHGITGYFRMDSPATPENIRLHCSDRIISKINKATPNFENVTPWNIQL